MAPRSEEQYTQTRREKTQLILDTALELIATHGYDNTSISQLAEAAGMSKGLIYNYFPGKEALLKQILMTGFEHFMTCMQIANPEHIHREELVKFVEDTLDFLVRNPAYYRLYFSLAMQPRVFELLGKEFQKVLEDISRYFIRYFQQEGIAEPYARTRYLLALLDGVGMHYLADSANFPMEPVKKMIIEML